MVSALCERAGVFPDNFEDLECYRLLLTSFAVYNTPPSSCALCSLRPQMAQ